MARWCAPCVCVGVLIGQTTLEMAGNISSITSRAASFRKKCRNYFDIIFGFEIDDVDDDEDIADGRSPSLWYIYQFSSE